MSEKILVTDFNRFDQLGRPNASSEVALHAVAEKYGDFVETLILPTAVGAASSRLRYAIENINPAAVVIFGLSFGAKAKSAESKVILEKRARNRLSSQVIPNSEGKLKIARVDMSGPRSYDSTLPINRLYHRLIKAEVPTEISTKPGTSIGDALAYLTLRDAGVRRRNGDQINPVIPTGFIHLGNGLSGQVVEEASILVIDELITHTAKTK